MSDKRTLGKFSFKPKRTQNGESEADRLLNEVASEFSKSNERKERRDQPDRKRSHRDREKDEERKRPHRDRETKREKLYFRDPYPSIHHEKIAYERYIDTILGTALVLKTEDDNTILAREVLETRPRWSKFVYSTPRVLSRILTDSDPPDALGEEPLIESLRRERAQLNSTTKQTPQDVESWYKLALVERNLFILEHDAPPTSTVIVDVIQSMFKTAAKMSNHPQLVREHIRLVREKSEKVQIALDFAVKTPCPEIWELLLDCCVDDWSTSFSALEIEEKWFKAGYMDKLWKLKDSHDPTLIEATALSVTYRLAKFLRDSGYTERAIGIYQGLIELNLFAPEALKDLPLDRVLYAMQQYWDMETKRFGDMAAPKWKKTGQKDEPPEHNVHAVASLDDDFNTVLFPSRSIHEFALNDPDSVVLFDDIRLYMVKVSTANISQLLFMFMSLIGVSTPSFFDVDAPVHRADAKTVVEIIRQLTHTSEQLPEDFVSWTLEFIAANDSEFFKKYSRYMLNKPHLRQNVWLYQKVATLDSAFATAIYDTIGGFYKFADVDTALKAWISWGADDIGTNLQHRRQLLEVYESLALAQANRDLRACSSFIYCYLTSIGDEIRRNVSLRSALDSFWAQEPSFGYPEIFLVIDKVLTKHMSLPYSSIVPVQFHYRKLCRRVESSLYYSDQPSASSMYCVSQILANIARFQVEHHWRVSVPLLRLPMCDHHALRVLLYQYHSAILGQAPAQQRREFYMQALLGEEDNGRTLMYSVLESPSVWLDYFYYELSVSRTTGDYFTPKLVYLQALRHCGWSKDVLLAGLQSLSEEVLPPKERRDILQAAVQRELHIRADLSSLI